MISREALRAVMAMNDRADPRYWEIRWADPRYWAIRWQYLKGDGFFDDLLRAAAHADEDNLVRIGWGFPHLAEAVRRWKNVPGWAQETEAWAESLASKEDAHP